MTFRPLGYAALAGALPLAVLAPAARATAPTVADPAAARAPVCDIRGTGQRGDHHLCGIERLGPWPLPARAPMARLLQGYTPLGSSPASEFQLRWSNGTKGWRNPPFHGFAIERFPSFTLIVRTPLWVGKGQYVDRFGPAEADLLSPAGVPFAKRSLPPDTLNDAPRTYHCYRVDRAFKVMAGPARPWFGQPGKGRQYHLGYDTHGRRLEENRRTTVADLVRGRYLHEVKDKNACRPR
jgi:Tuberculosis necrotizing toxin